MTSDKLKDKVSRLPDAPGVYIFKDAQGAILYIGKATSLKKRVQSYFSRLLSAKIQAMVAKIADVEYRLSASESQAQLLESSLIKEQQPPYNTDLKDDKSFPLLRVTDDEFPILSVCRRKKPDPHDTSTYFGPYTDAALLRQAFKVIRKIFGFRSCKTMPDEICLYGRINLCPAPCCGKISSKDYKEIIKNITLLLDSQYSVLIDKLMRQMQELSAGQKFEEAAALRDQVNALCSLTKAGGQSRGINELEELQELLKMERLPARIEAFDISNISGREACGSMVSFHKGLPDKNNYRRFRIKTVTGIDDYKMLAEVVRRRYSRLVREHLALPDLILIDGGKSHLLTAEKELEALGLNIPLASIAKDRENIYVKGKRNPLHFTHDTAALNVIRRVRDEAHRFAVSYHHILRRKKILGK